MMLDYVTLYRNTKLLCGGDAGCSNGGVKLNKSLERVTLWMLKTKLWL